MQATHPIRTIPRRALALALILIAVLVLAGLSGYLFPPEKLTRPVLHERDAGVS